MTLLSRRIRVAIRPRPISENELKGSNHTGNIEICPEDNSIRVSLERGHDYGQKQTNRQGMAAASEKKMDTWRFTFDKVFGMEVSQEELFQGCAREMVDSALDGVNGTILTYGQTGSGKTYTISGKSENYNTQGLAPRTLSHLFKEMENRRDSSFNIKLSYLELYNEKIYDLLSPNFVADEKISQNSHFEVTKRVISNVESALELIFEGETNRAIASHELNDASSRSHCVIIIDIEARRKVLDEEVGTDLERITHSKLNIVDLAGSERQSKTNSTGEVFKEAKNINQSLSFLEQVVLALGDKNRDHIPYRQSKLTHMLQDSLGGNCNTLMLSCIWPKREHLEQTLSTLRFAIRMMRVKNKPVINDKPTVDSAILSEYKREIHQLRMELALRDSFMKGTNKTEGALNNNYKPYTPEQMNIISDSVDKFLETGDEKLIRIQSVRHAYSMLHICREKVLIEKKSRQILDMEPNLKVKAKPAIEKQNQEETLSAVNNTNQQQDRLERTPVPPMKLKQPPTKTKYRRPRITDDERIEKPTETCDDDFKKFLHSTPEGKSLNEAIQEAKCKLLERRSICKETKKVINLTKRQLDSALEQLESVQDVSTEKQKALVLIKSLKGEYKQHFTKLQETKSEVVYCSQVVERCRKSIAAEFTKWLSIKK